MKKLQKIIFFLGAISLVVFGNRDAISTITSKGEAAAPQVEVITSTPATTATPPATTAMPTTAAPAVPTTTKKKVATPAAPTTTATPAAPTTTATPAKPATPATPAAVEKPKEVVKPTTVEPAKKEKATSSK